MDSRIAVFDSIIEILLRLGMVLERQKDPNGFLTYVFEQI